MYHHENSRLKLGICISVLDYATKTCYAHHQEIRGNWYKTSQIISALLKEYSFVIWQSIFQKISRKSQISIWLWKLTHCEKQGLRLKTLAKNKIKILDSLFIFKKKLRNILDMHVKNYNKKIKNLNNPFHWKFNLKEIFSMSCFSDRRHCVMDLIRFYWFWDISRLII